MNAYLKGFVNTKRGIVLEKDRDTIEKEYQRKFLVNYRKNKIKLFIKEILKMIQKCHKLAYKKEIECKFEERNLSISVNRRIECKKLSKTSRTLIGNKYASELL